MKKLFFIFFIYLIFLLSLLIFSSLIAKEFYYGEPNREEALKIIGYPFVRLMSESGNLIYSKKSRSSIQEFFRVSCFVFQFSEKDFNMLKKNNFYFSEPVRSESFEYEQLPANKVDFEGCKDFRSSNSSNKTMIFEHYKSDFGGTKGMSIFINEKNKTVMFEKYEIPITHFNL